MAENYREDLSPRKKEVFKYIEENLDEIEEDYPGNKEIAKELGCSKNTVRQALKEAAIGGEDYAQEIMMLDSVKRKSLAVEYLRRNGDYGKVEKIKNIWDKEKREEIIEETLNKYMS